MDEGALHAKTVSGRVGAGVEPGSVVLRDGDGVQWQLGRTWGHLVGCTVRLVGRPRPDVMTTAQQGTVFAVDEVEVLAGTPRESGGPGPGHHEI